MNELIRKSNPQEKNQYSFICVVMVLLLFVCLPSKAQQTTVVKGTVMDVKKETLIGAIVREKDGKSGTSTDLEGQFSISVSNPNATLIISSIGMRPVEVPLKGKTNIEVYLEEDNIALDEVVVTALGIKRQTKALGYAVSEVSGDDITEGRETNVMSALSGKVAGVDISSTNAGPSGSTRVIIRGNTQLTGTNMPLYVIDGVPIDNTQLGEAGKWGGYDYGDGVSSLNPEDIESISVLKGASASALYGSRASNGVILITTKSAKKSKALGIDLSLNVTGVALNKSFDDYQREYGQGSLGKITSDFDTGRKQTAFAWGAKLDPNLKIPIYNGEMKPYGNVNNNILSFFRTGYTLSNSIALSNAGDNGDFRISVSDMRNNDIVPKSDMSRTSFAIKGSAKLGSKIRVEGRANYIYEKVNNRPALSDHPGNIGLALIGMAPNFNQKWLSENYKDEYGRYNVWSQSVYKVNPYWTLNEMSNESTRNRVMGHLQFSYQILPILKFQAKAGTDFYDFNMIDYVGAETPYLLHGGMDDTKINVSENNYEAMLRYEQKLGKFDVSAFVGGNIMQYHYKRYNQHGEKQNAPELVSILNYMQLTLTKSEAKKQVNSIYGAVNLGYNDYAFLDVTLRNDVSSTLPKANRSYMYPSVSGSFIFSKYFDLEKGVLSFGKIRASWAKVGGDTSPYKLNLTYQTSPEPITNIPWGTISVLSSPEKNLKPTSTYSHEFGIDLRFFQSRLNLDLGYYNQITKDQIMNMPISTSSGYNSATVNAGEIRNKGFEMSLSGIPIQTKDFTWTSTLNMAKNINEVVSLHPEARNYELAAARWADAYIYAIEKESYGVIYGPVFKRDPHGNVIHDKNGMPTYSSQWEIMGNGTYDFTAGWSNRFNYKNFNLNILLDMKWGADIYSMSALQSYSNGTSKGTLPGRKEWYEYEESRLSGATEGSPSYREPNGYVGKGVVEVVDDKGNVTYEENTKPVNPQEYWTNVTNNTPEPFVYDASFIKLREVSLSYRVPAKVLVKTPIRELTLSAYGRNLWIIHTKMKNVDPESNYNSGNGQGFEYGSLPTRRLFGFGINLKF